MSGPILQEPVALRLDENGDYRVGDSRILLDLVVHEFEEGATPEQIIQSYDTLRLADVYSVITYYLRHLEEVKEYLKRREEEADKLQAEIEARQGDMSEFRNRLLARRAAMVPKPVQ
jgi:uncharacterized protein (DUF433 family)